ncbi:hypothetical protein NBRC111893_2109 [Lentilactobacillus kosonis]|uniref:Uncharacterized protein n=1 Tax=Lentilactobacillus kosonis TaxID=2810561 RepID=A0A401FNP2_9LACO|nr:hypothetical protein NBRC111893_2109 [Lentilactobacillus kosonis]
MIYVSVIILIILLYIVLIGLATYIQLKRHKIRNDNSKKQPFVFSDNHRIDLESATTFKAVFWENFKSHLKSPLSLFR